MKKTFLLLSLISILLGASAQEMSYGVKAGLNASTLNSSTYGWSTLKPGYYVGGYFSYGVLDFLNVSIEPNFRNHGASKFEIDNLFFDQQLLLEGEEFAKHSIAINSLEVPLLAHYKLELAGMDARIFAGPSMDFVLKGYRYSYKEDVKAGEELFSEINHTEDITENYLKYWDFGAKAGIGVDFEMMGLLMNIDLSYRMAFTDISNVATKPSLYSNTISLGIGIGLGN